MELCNKLTNIYNYSYINAHQHPHYSPQITLANIEYFFPSHRTHENTRQKVITCIISSLITEILWWKVQINDKLCEKDNPYRFLTIAAGFFYFWVCMVSSQSKIPESERWRNMLVPFQVRVPNPAWWVTHYQPKHLPEPPS